MVDASELNPGVPERNGSQTSFGAADAPYHLKPDCAKLVGWLCGFTLELALG